MSWQDDAACRGHDLQAWFPERGQSAREAVLICGGCPVAQQCLDNELNLMLKLNFTAGIIAGTNERTRRRMILGREPAVPAAPTAPVSNTTRKRYTLGSTHGTEAGYQWHRHHQESACDACKAAHRRYWHHRRKVRKVA